VLETVLAALCLVWTRHLLKVAIADIAATSDRDCHVVGLDRAEILAALTALHSAAQSTTSRSGRSVLRRPEREQMHFGCE
jgi:hypothetical protein